MAAAPSLTTRRGVTVCRCSGTGLTSGMVLSRSMIAIFAEMWEARAIALRGLIAGLCVAAATAIAARATGEFDDTHRGVIATSLGFSLFSAFGASGDALRRGAGRWGGGRGPRGA